MRPSKGSQRSHLFPTRILKWIHSTWSNICFFECSVSESLHLKLDLSTHLTPTHAFQCISKGSRKCLTIAYYSLTFISQVHLIIKKCQGQILLRLRVIVRVSRALNLWGGHPNPPESFCQQKHGKTEKVTLLNPFRPPHKKLPYTALIYRNVTLKVIKRSKR